MSGPVLRSSKINEFNSHKRYSEVDPIIILVLQLRKSRHRDLSNLLSVLQPPSTGAGTWTPALSLTTEPSLLCSSVHCSWVQLCPSKHSLILNIRDSQTFRDILENRIRLPLKNFDNYHLLFNNFIKKKNSISPTSQVRRTQPQIEEQQSCSLFEWKPSHSFSKCAWGTYSV